MGEILKLFTNFEEYKTFILKNKKKKLLHPSSEKNLGIILNNLYSTTYQIPEVNVSGGRADLVFYLLPFNISVHFEIFASKSQVPQDLRLLENSKFDIQIAILIDKEIDSTVSEEFYRKRPEKPFQSFELSNIFIESKIEAFKNTFSNIINKFLKENEIIIRKPEIEIETDNTPEYIYPNLFAIVQYPVKIYLFSSSYNGKYSIIENIKQKFGEEIEILPFIYRDTTILSFFNLNEDNILKDYVNDLISILDLQNLLEDDSRKGWVTELFNVFLKSYLIKNKNLEFDGNNKRYYFWKSGEEDKKVFHYYTGIKYSTISLYWKKEDYYVHRATSLQFVVLADNLFLSIQPSFIFTTDGINLIPSESRAGLYTRYLNIQFNPHVLNSIRFWLKFLSNNEEFIEFSINDVIIKVSSNFNYAECPIGNSEDYLNRFETFTGKVKEAEEIKDEDLGDIDEIIDIMKDLEKNEEDD